MDRHRPAHADARRRRPRNFLYGIFLWSLCTAAGGAENNNQTDNAEEENGNQEQTEDQQPEMEMPDLEFIEFLGQFETDAGEWIAPGNLLMNEFDNFLDVIANQQDTDN